MGRKRKAVAPRISRFDRHRGETERQLTLDFGECRAGGQSHDDRVITRGEELVFSALAKILDYKPARPCRPLMNFQVFGCENEEPSSKTERA